MQALGLDLHEGAASGSHQAEHGESVNDEAQLLVWQQRVDEDEAYGGEQQQPHPPVEEAEGDEEQRAAQGAGHGGVKIPQKGRGLLGRGELRRAMAWRWPVSEVFIKVKYLNICGENTQVNKRIFPSWSFC